MCIIIDCLYLQPPTNSFHSPCTMVHHLHLGLHTKSRVIWYYQFFPLKIWTILQSHQTFHHTSTRNALRPKKAKKKVLAEAKKTCLKHAHRMSSQTTCSHTTLPSTQSLRFIVPPNDLQTTFHCQDNLPPEPSYLKPSTMHQHILSNHSIPLQSTTFCLLADQ